MGNKPKSDETTYIALNLKPWRKRKGWTQAQLAERLNTTDATIARIENGKQNWKQDFLLAAAKVLDCSIQDLLPAPHGTMMEMFQALPPERQEVALDIVKGLKAARE